MSRVKMDHCAEWEETAEKIVTENYLHLSEFLTEYKKVIPDVSL